MSDTTELPAPTDAMTATDLDRHLKSICALIGPHAYGSASVSVGHFHKTGAHVGIYTEEVYRNGEHFWAPTWPEAIAAAYEWARTRRPIWRDATIRKLALAIIDLTDQHHECTERLLLMREFSREVILEFHEAACVRANEMAGGAPFKVVLAT